MSEVENSKPKKYIEKKKKAIRIIRFRMLMASGVGFVPFPILDAAGIVSIQLWMISDLAKIYDVPFKKNIARSIIGTLVGNVGAVSLLKLIPGINILGSGAVAMSAGATTYALGKVFTQHFDQGGTLLSFDPIKSRAYFEQVYEESKITVEELKGQEDSFKEADTQALASVATLKNANSQLMETITNLEKQLRSSKKERAVAVAVAKTQTRAKQIIPNIKDKSKRKGLIGWLWRIGLVVVFIALVLFALFQFNVIGNGSKNNNSSVTDSLSTSGIIDPNSTIISDDNNLVIDTTAIDTASIIGNPADSANSIISDTTDQRVRQNNPNPDSLATDNGTSSVTPQQDTSSRTLAN